QRRRQTLGLLQPGRQSNSTHTAAPLVILPAGANEIATHHRLNGQCRESTHNRGAPLQQGTLVGVLDYALERPIGQVVRHDMSGTAKPEIRNLVQYPSLLG